MTSIDQTRRWFVIGSAVLGVLIVVGLIWAVVSGGNPLPSGPGAVSFDDANDPRFGASSSTVTVRVFGDFQCPACRTAESGFAAAKKAFADRVTFVWDDFPLTQIHTNAMNAANAARCAEAQGKFWEYHDLLYADQPTWSSLPDPRAKFVAYAGNVGINADQFAACYDKKEFQNNINADMNEGWKNGVDSTPTFFINKTMVVGAMTEAEWTDKLNAALAGK